VCVCACVFVKERDGERERGTWRKGSLTGNLERYVRHVKEGFRNGAPFSFQRLQYGNLEGRLTH